MDDNRQRPGYTFAGWATQQNSSTVKYKPGEVINVTSNLTLYGVWTKNKATYSVGLCRERTVNSSGNFSGANCRIYSVKEDGTITLPTSVVVVNTADEDVTNNYVLLGWGTSIYDTAYPYASGTDKSVAPYTIGETVTITSDMVNNIGKVSFYPVLKKAK